MIDVEQHIRGALSSEAAAAAHSSWTPAPTEEARCTSKQFFPTVQNNFPSCNYGLQTAFRHMALDRQTRFETVSTATLHRVRQCSL